MEINKNNNQIQLSGFTTSNPEKFIQSLAESFNLTEGAVPTVRLNRRHMILEDGKYIKDCSFLVTNEMCQEYFFNSYLIENAALLEGAKLDVTLKNFLKEGKDYKGLKKDIQEIIDAFDLDDSKLKSGRSSIMHTIKRILQICTDLILPLDMYMAGSIGIENGIKRTMVSGAKQVYDYKKNMWVTTVPAVISTTYNIPAMVIGAIIALIVSFLINRLWRLLWDYIEYDTIKKDGESVIRQLKKISHQTKDKKLKKKAEDAIKKLEDKMNEYEKKDKKSNKKSNEKKN